MAPNSRSRVRRSEYFDGTYEYNILKLKESLETKLERIDISGTTDPLEDSVKKEICAIRVLIHKYDFVKIITRMEYATLRSFQLT